jgi:hypothetical protein
LKQRTEPGNYYHNWQKKIQKLWLGSRNCNKRRYINDGGPQLAKEDTKIMVGLKELQQKEIHK